VCHGQLLHAVGVTRVVLVGRSAACTSKFGGPGDVLIVNDHVNFSGRNPLFGPNDDKCAPTTSVTLIVFFVADVPRASCVVSCVSCRVVSGGACASRT
jgi:purine nucleoside phosphorylase